MTFKNESIRFAFHKLPTERQVEFTDFEERAAKRGLYLIIEDVKQEGTISEVLMRIGTCFEVSPPACHDCADR